MSETEVGPEGDEGDADQVEQEEAGKDELAEGGAEVAAAPEAAEGEKPLEEQKGPAPKAKAKRNLAETMATLALGGTNLVLRPAVVKFSDMPKLMEHYCIELAHLSMMKYYKENEMARFIKKNVEDKYTDLWHVLVGKNFGLSVTHEEKRYIYFYCGQMAFVIFKAGMPF